MIEATILSELNAKLDKNAYISVPATRPSAFYVVQRTGGNMTDYIKTATLAIQSYAPTMYEAASMNEAMKAVMYGLVERADISAVVLNSDYNYTDTSEKTCRYQAVFVVTYFD